MPYRHRRSRRNAEPRGPHLFNLEVGYATHPTAHTCDGPTPEAAEVWAESRDWCLAHWRQEFDGAERVRVPWAIWSLETRDNESSVDAARRLGIVPRNRKQPPRVDGWTIDCTKYKHIAPCASTPFLPEFRDRQAVCPACIAEQDSNKKQSRPLVLVRESNG